MPEGQCPALKVQSCPGVESLKQQEQDVASLHVVKMEAAPKTPFQSQLMVWGVGCWPQEM